MSLICLGSAHGSPGATTTALAIAATWPEHRRCLLVEADPFGGVIAARYRLGDSPGLSSLAAIARRGLDDEVVWQHTQQLPGGIPVLIGPPTAEEAHAVLRDLARILAEWAVAQAEVDVIVDCGRIAPGSAMLTAMTAADLVLVVTRPSIDQLRPAAARSTALTTGGVRSGLLLVGDHPYGPGEVAATLDVDVAGVIAWDPRTAAVLTGLHGAVRDLRRTPLVRSAATLAAELAPTPDPTPEVGVDVGSAGAGRVSFVGETGS
ncbi:MAG: chromosome partitioning protein [Acidimicrobiia bacterium]